MSHVLPARVRFLRPDEGGRTRPSPSGLRSQLRIGDVLTSVVVHGTGDRDAFSTDSEEPVRIEVLFWEAYGPLLDRSLPVELYEGSRLIAVGTFLDTAGLG